MFGRILVTGAIVCGLLAATAVASPDPATAELLKGRTAQGYPIKIVTRGSAFKLVRFEADLRCRDGSQVILVESGFLWTPTKKNGSFRDAQFGKTDSVYFRGRMNENRIRGRIRLTDKVKGQPKCSSRWIKFNVARR